MSIPSERLTKLQSMLAKSPGDTFLLYAIAMELKKSGDMSAAIEAFNTVIQHDWGYCYAYHQKGLAYEAIGDTENARSAYRDGIAAAEKKGEAHAKEEIAAALSMLE